MTKRREAMGNPDATGREIKLSTLIARSIHTDVNGRFLRNMPAFRADDRLPDEFQSLLGALDRAERR
jgi:hypothetical protein